MRSLKINSISTLTSDLLSYITGRRACRGVTSLHLLAFAGGFRYLPFIFLEPLLSESIFRVANYCQAYFSFLFPSLSIRTQILFQIFTLRLSVVNINVISNSVSKYMYMYYYIYYLFR